MAGLSILATAAIVAGKLIPLPPPSASRESTRVKREGLGQGDNTLMMDPHSPHLPTLFQPILADLADLALQHRAGDARNFAALGITRFLSAQAPACFLVCNPGLLCCRLETFPRLFTFDIVAEALHMIQWAERYRTPAKR